MSHFLDRLTYFRKYAGTFADGTFWSAEVEPGQSRAIRH